MVGWVEAAGAGRDEFRPDWAAKKRRGIGHPMLLNSCSLDPRKYIEFLSAILRIGLPVMCGAVIKVYPTSLALKKGA